MKTKHCVSGVAVLFFLLVGCGRQSSTATSTTDTSSRETTVTKIIVQQLKVSSTKVTPESRLVTDLGADEFDIVELIMSIEETYGIEISDEAVEKKLEGQPASPSWNLSVRDLIDLAEKK